ncbi:nuclear transport factor 2 family protein [Roseovarius sp. B08]|uniref:nuclear transport factor 2 family protein n=1 Tax=Roseovarius sp. B08 TaxID=3449223 RepID=UPI003EDC0C44
MPIDHFPIGSELDVSYPDFKVSLTLLSVEHLKFDIKEGPFARTETVDIEVASLGNGIFAVSWQESDGATVTNIQDFDRRVIHSFATLPDGQFLRMTGPFAFTAPAGHVTDARPQHNKALVLDAMTSLFQRHDTSAVQRLYSEDYVQHNPNIPQGRDALQRIVETLSKSVYYEPGLIIAEGDLVAIHGRIRGWADETQIVVDIFPVEGGKLAEHWDVLQNEVTAASGMAALSMFDPAESARR